jgi:hypothetical protein
MTKRKPGRKVKHYSNAFEDKIHRQWREAQGRFYERHKEKVKEYSRRYHELHKKKAKEPDPKVRQSGTDGRNEGRGKSE